MLLLFYFYLKKKKTFYNIVLIVIMVMPMKQVYEIQSLKKGSGRGQKVVRDSF